MADSLLSSNFDIIFIILSFLPTETLLLVNSVCRAWAQVISDPAFVRAHYSRPTPIAGFFPLNSWGPDNRIEEFKKLTKDTRFPTSLSSILSDHFKAVCGNHGLLCLHKSGTFVICNPVTSQWVVVHDTNPSDRYIFQGAALLYDPATSLHFKLTVAMVTMDLENDDELHIIRFHIYSSENSSWVVSSVYPFQFWARQTMFDFGTKGNDVYKPSIVGGGSVCWLDDSLGLRGYEISSDTYWETKICCKYGTKRIVGYNGIIHFINVYEGVARVWRLEDKNSWALEGECSYELPRSPFAYDHVRGALLVGVGGEVIVLDLASSRSEILSCGVEFTEDVFNVDHDLLDHHLLHANTLAPLYVAED